jgi:hypothetical protein
MDSKTFAWDTLERAAKTFAQVLVSFFTAGVTIGGLDWAHALNVSVTAAVVSVLTSVASLPVSENGTASLVGAVKLRRGAIDFGVGEGD